MLFEILTIVAAIATITQAVIAVLDFVESKIEKREQETARRNQ